MITQQDLFRNFLEQYFRAAKGRNSLFSLRAMARKAKIHPAALSQFMKGKRNFSQEMILRIAHEIGLNSEQIFLLKREDIKEQSQSADLAKTVKIDNRDYTFNLMTIHSDQLPLAKKMIREFKYKLLRTLETGEKEDVYEVCIHLSPKNKPSFSPSESAI